MFVFVQKVSTSWQIQSLTKSYSDLVDGTDTFADWCTNSGSDDICVCDEPCKGDEDEFCGGSENFPIQTLTLTVEPAVVKLTYELEVVEKVVDGKIEQFVCYILF